MPISLNKARSISPKTLLKLINRAKKHLKDNKTIREMCKEYSIDTSILDIIPIKFGDLPVSARTEKGIITLNYKLLCDGDFFKDYHYLCHEIQHWLDQCLGERPTKGADEGSYLDNEAEQKGFQAQLEYIDDTFGKDEADTYVEHLLDHHKVDDDQDRKEKKEVLMEKV